MRFICLIVLVCLGAPLAAAQEAGPVNIPARMNAVIDLVDLRDVTARAALQWWSRTTGVNVSVNWEAMEADGVSPDTPVTVFLREVPASQALGLIVEHMQPEFTRLIVEVTPWDVRVMTRAQALRHPVLRVYDLGDLLIEPRNGFGTAPRLDLSAVLEQSGGGRGAGGGGSSIFTEEEAEAEPRLTRAQRGEQIAQMVRDSIEPDIWQANGGEYASVRYWNGRLIVNAPPYVHRQIGLQAAPRVMQVNPDYQAPKLNERGQRRQTGTSGVGGSRRSTSGVR